MSIATSELINNLVINDVKCFNDKFIEVAIHEWDKYGQGYFADFINNYVALQWALMVSKN